MEDYIVFRGIDSRAMRVRITKKPPISRPPERVSEEKVPGRHGSLTQTDGERPTYDSYAVPIEGVMLPGADEDAVKAWLAGGGDLVSSADPDRKQTARITDAIFFEQILPGRKYWRFKATFKAQPLKYEVNPGKLEYYQPGSIRNPGTMESQPTLTVYGNGDITLTVNDIPVYLTGIEGSITLDGELGDAYNDTALLNNSMQGDFPIFEPGMNSIAWTGEVQRVVIEPRWRWL